MAAISSTIAPSTTSSRYASRLPVRVPGSKLAPTPGPSPARLALATFRRRFRSMLPRPTTMVPHFEPSAKPLRKPIPRYMQATAASTARITQRRTQQQTSPRTKQTSASKSVVSVSSPVLSSASASSSLPVASVAPVLATRGRSSPASMASTPAASEASGFSTSAPFASTSLCASSAPSLAASDHDTLSVKSDISGSSSSSGIVPTSSRRPSSGPVTTLEQVHEADRERFLESAARQYPRQADLVVATTSPSSSSGNSCSGESSNSSSNNGTSFGTMLDKFPSLPVRRPLPLPQPAAPVSRSALPPVSSPVFSVNSSVTTSAVSSERFFPRRPSAALGHRNDSALLAAMSNLSITDRERIDTEDLVDDLLDYSREDIDFSAANAAELADILTGRLPVQYVRPRRKAFVPRHPAPVNRRLRPRLANHREVSFSTIPADPLGSIMGTRLLSAFDNTRAFSTGSIWELTELAEGTQLRYCSPFSLADFPLDLAVGTRESSLSE
ncbi:hypothetical protein MBLNU457_g0141t1 [Dothideomycetes sp. NU457]